MSMRARRRPSDVVFLTEGEVRAGEVKSSFSKADVMYGPYYYRHSGAFGNDYFVR